MSGANGNYKGKLTRNCAFLGIGNGANANLKVLQLSVMVR